ncbi:MAG: RecQ family ATP-dependent DNA helicase [Nocardioidaceae bacterium]
MVESASEGLTAPHRTLATGVIRALAGSQETLRPDQERAVAALVQPRARVLVVQATGWGKSAVYWAATAIRRAEGAGPTLVVSPLLSLMRDQIAAAVKAGLQARTLNSSNVDEWAVIEAELLAGDVDVLLVSPERLANPGFGRRVLDTLAGRIGLLVIDEAHAVSDWGHDFRPDYRRISDVLRQLNPDTPVLATTATANDRVTTDVAHQLGDATLVLRGPLARSSLQLTVVAPMSPLERYAWVVDHLPALPGSGIVYTLTVADAERLAGVVSTVHGDDVPVAAYTGGLDPAERERLEDALRDNHLKVLVSTSALGMGFDKPDLGFIVHVGSPPSPVSYYQQVGRAGRGIDHALVTLLPSEADDGVWDYFATATIPDPRLVHRVLDTLPSGADHPASVPALEAETGIRRGKVELILKQLAVHGAVERVDRGWLRTGRPWAFDAEHYDGIVATRRREAMLMRAYAAGERCLMQLLQESLDDPTAAPCGRCSVCLQGLPEPLTARPSAQTVETVTGLLRGDTHRLEPRKMWPGGQFGSRGRIPAELSAEVGRTLIFADAPEWREIVQVAFANAGPAPDELKDGCVRLLSEWRHEWPARPQVVVGLASSGHRQLVLEVAGHLASAGRLERADFEVTSEPPDFSDQGSGAEAAWWRDSLEVTAGLAASVNGRAVLLLVDASASLWPITIAAAKLREAGAGPLLPLLLHRRP